MRAAKIEWKATSLDVQDKRDGVILDTALSYAQLSQLTKKIETLTEAQKAAKKGEFVSQQRLQQGVDSKLDVTRSQLLERAFACASPKPRDRPMFCGSTWQVCWACSRMQ